MSNIRNVDSLVFNADALDITGAMKLISMVDKGNVSLSSLPEFMEIVGRMVEGGLDGVPFTQMNALANRVMDVLSEASNPKEASAVSETA